MIAPFGHADLPCLSGSGPPVDATLLDRVLDPARLTAWLAPEFARIGGPEPHHIQVRYARAKAGRSLLLGMELFWGDAHEAKSTWGSLYVAAPQEVASASRKAQTLRLLEPSRGPTGFVDSGGGAFFLAYPNDRVLRGLSAAADPRRLGNRLVRSSPEGFPDGASVRARASRVELCRWKVGRRAVLRADLSLRGREARWGGCEMYVRVYPTAQLAEKVEKWHVANRCARDAQPPELLGFDAERGLTFTAVRPGHTLANRDRWTPADWGRGLEALRSLYSADLEEARSLPVRSDQGDLDTALRPLAALRGWVPDWAGDIDELREELVNRLGKLGERSSRLIHGDLKPDQILEDGNGIAVLDWDECSVGDPLFDFATFAVDGDLPADEVQARASDLLGQRFNENRWRWQLGLAWARRVLAGMQRGRASWREEARHSLNLARVTTLGGIAKRSRRSPLPANRVLQALLDPASRRTLPGVNGRTLRLAAVWPERDGFSARLEEPGRPGVPALWVQGDELRVWPFPEDPGLTGLRELLASGHRLAGHRFSRRATLEAVECTPHFLHLRTSERARPSHARVTAVQAALEASGIAVPRIGALDPRLHAFPSERWPNAIIGGCLARPVWLEVGRLLAAVHATPPPSNLPVSSPTRAAQAASRQMALVRLLGREEAKWLPDSLEAWSERASALGMRPQRRAFLHGDLHPAQIATGPPLTFLDWEWAAVGDPESDVGNLAAQLLWMDTEAAGDSLSALLAGYREKGGVLESRLLTVYAALSLLRILAVHSWRDDDRRRVLGERALWNLWPNGIQP